MMQRAITAILVLLALVSTATAKDQSLRDEITSVIGEVVVTGGSLKADQKARKELEAIARKLAKLPKQRMIEIEGSFPLKNLIEIEGVYPQEKIEEYFTKSFYLAMEAEGYIRDSLGVNLDYYLSARNRNELKAAKPLIRIVLHSGTFVKQPVGAAETSSQPAKASPIAPIAVPASVPVFGEIPAPAAATTPQVTPIIPEGMGGQSAGGYQPAEPAADTSPIDERLVTEQAIRAQALIEQTKAKAAERERQRLLEEKNADSAGKSDESVQPK